MILQTPIMLMINNEQVETSNLDIILIDHQSRKLVLARLGPMLAPLVLWNKEAYDSVGDYTQAQVEDRILELLGDNPQYKLQSLIISE